MKWTVLSDNRTNDSQLETEHGHAIAHIPQNHPVPKGNQNLYVQNTNGNFIHDDFRHELALYTDGLLFTGCAHSGLENIHAFSCGTIKYEV